MQQRSPQVDSWPTTARRSPRVTAIAGVAATTSAHQPMIRLAAIYRSLGLREDPFAVGPHPAAMAVTPAIVAASAQIRSWLAERTDMPSLAVITGDAGSGRTTLVTDALAHLPESSPVVPIVIGVDEEKLTDVRLLRSIVTAFGNGPVGRNGLDLVNQIRELATTVLSAGQLPVIVLDNADISGSRLDVLRSLLTPPATASDGYDLRILLTGASDLRDRLTRRRSLAHQIAHTIELRELTRDEVSLVLSTRIDAVVVHDEKQTEPPPRFDDDAIDIITTWSAGNSRAVIALAGECLLEAIARGMRNVDRAIAHEVARELTDRARQQARVTADAPYIVPAVQTKLALSIFGEEDERSPAAPTHEVRRRGRS